MTSVGNHVTSYDTGSKPFKHDETRGKWSSTGNFVLACIGHAFGLSNFSVLPVFIMMHGGVFFIIPYTIGLLVFALPVFFIQSFLGQFSSTGFISVFRISPLFKGIGYVILLLNITSASFFAVAAAYPLVYFFVSFSIDLPWMSCKHTWNSENCTEIFVNTTDEYGWYDLSWSTAEFFERLIGFGQTETKLSIIILGGTLIVWVLVALTLLNGIKSVEKVVTYSVTFIVISMLILFIRFSFLAGAAETLYEFIKPKDTYYITEVVSYVGSPFMVTMVLGSGWGTILTMASYNNFKANISKYSWLTAISITFLNIIGALIIAIADNYLIKHLHFSGERLGNTFSVHGFLFVAMPHLFANMEAGVFWALIFYLMLFLCEFCAVIIMMFSILTAIFDEYEVLRLYKTKISLALPGVLFVFSIIFCGNLGLYLLTFLLRFSGVTQMLICFLELIVVVWVYGRVRFQRDIQFMLCSTFNSWKFQFVRFVTPFFTLLMGGFHLGIAVNEMHHFFFNYIMGSIILHLVPWIMIPAYIIIKLCTTTGSFCVRFRRCTRPNDWYPVDPVDRHRYEESLGTSDISHQLVDMAEIEEN